MKPSKAETIVYKLTDANMQTYGGYQWALNEHRVFPGVGGLCASGWCHAYTSAPLALLLNPMHAGFSASSMRLFEGIGIVGATDRGLKVGCSTLTLTRELVVPQITLVHRAAFGILAALGVEVYKKKAWLLWAHAWLNDTDRSAGAAYAAHDAAGAAYAADAAYAAAGAADAAYASAGAAYAAYAAASAAYAAAHASGHHLDLNTIAARAVGIVPEAAQR